MWSAIILLLSIINTFILVHLLFREWRFLTKLGISIPSAIIFLGSFLFIIYSIDRSFLENSIFTVVLLSLLLLILVFYSRKKYNLNHFKISVIEILVIVALLLFSSWLMFGSFSYSKNENTLNIGLHLWSDFASHIPLIRSFSQGENFPPQFPLFPNENIRYHFLFYFLTGMLEKFGDNIALSLNLISTLSFFSLGILIFELSKTIFGGNLVGILAVLLTFLNSSLAFIVFFKENNLFNLATYKFIWERSSPFANAPYGNYVNEVITTFWSLNIYLNQRHLSLAFAAILIVVFIFYQSIQKGKAKLSHFIFSAILVGLLPYWHMQAFLITLLVTFLISLIFLRKYILRIFLYFWTIAFLSLPQLFWIQGSNTTKESLIVFQPGYLISPPISFLKAVFWWFQNLGLTLLIIPEALFTQKVKLRLFYLCFIPVFLAGFLFKFSPDIATNHKFFNFWLILTNLFIAALLVKIFSRNFFGKIIAIVLFLLLTFSGILELFPIKNDSKIALKDWQSNPVSSWVILNTPKDAIFITSNSLYHPVSLAGRKVFFGWPYFAWSAGSDTDKRGEITKLIYLGTDKKVLCQLLEENKIDYLIIEGGLEDSTYWHNKPFFDNNFEKVFTDQWENINYSIYDRVKSCHG